MPTKRKSDSNIHIVRALSSHGTVNKRGRTANRKVAALLTLLALVMLTFVAVSDNTISSAADTTDPETGLIYSIAGTNATITGWNRDGGDLTIPNQLNVRNVTKINDGAFKNKKLTSVIFNCTSLTTISKNAFSNTEIAEITIPSSIKSLGSGVFADCTSLKMVTFPSNATSEFKAINSSTFKNTALTSIVIPDYIVSISSNAFENCTHLNSISFGADSKLTTISGSAFKNTGLSSASLPKKLTTIGPSAFIDCRNLSEVTFADDSALITIGINAFSNTALRSITIPDSVTSIDDNSFLTAYI